MGTRIELSFRDRAILRAVDGGHADCSSGSSPISTSTVGAAPIRSRPAASRGPVSSSPPFPVRPRTGCRHASPPVDGSRPSEPEPCSSSVISNSPASRPRRTPSDTQYPIAWVVERLERSTAISVDHRDRPTIMPCGESDWYRQRTARDGHLRAVGASVALIEWWRAFQTRAP